MARPLLSFSSLMLQAKAKQITDKKDSQMGVFFALQRCMYGRETFNRGRKKLATLIIVDLAQKVK